MLYNAYEVQRAMLSGASSIASVWAEYLNNPANPWGYLGFSPIMASALEVFAHAYAPRGKPGWDITEALVDGVEYPVVEATVLFKPFCELKHFRREGLPEDAPRLLIVAPMSGHYATLLRGTVARMVENQDVYVTDWADAKMVPLDKGRFDLDDYIDYVIEFLEHLGPNTHVVAVCQPSVPAYAATAIMGAEDNPCRPASLTMMGGPIDTREAPTSVNDVATERPLSWFRNNVIATVPLAYPGAGRQVYPGFLQLSGFIAMNLGSHLMSHYQYFQQMIEGDDDGAAAHKAFYDEYLSVCDLTAEFYIQTVEHVFKEHSLPNGTFEHRGKVIDLKGIKDTALLAIEGERDDISGIGQTKAALKLATGLPEVKKQYHLAKDAGHYGIFNGSKWRNRIAPVVEAWMRANPGVGTAKLKVVA
ncbi:MAG: polyhydroxyalkanoate depolymerase [Novosphingobium sp.]|nr:polyhydroxyalkanoate depolymerase [Novosphingobium sp.]MBO9602209.1 polyhydroxyalkanoate depolymerase [Novosphingobium sp.]